MELHQKLVNLLTYAKDNIGFYKDLIPSKLSEKNIIEVVSSLPLSSKGKIKQDYKDNISKEILKHDTEFLFNTEFDFKKKYKYSLSPNLSIILEFTSGSSGTPLMIIKTVKERLLLGRNIWKLRNGVSTVKPNELFDFAHAYNDNNGYPFPFEEERDDKKRLVKEFKFLKNSNYKWWHMNTYDIEFYYNYICNKGIEFIKNDILEIIENNGSYLSINDKQKYSELFSCKIIDHYGCSETWMVALDCNHGNLHVNEENIYFELINDGKIINESNKVGNVVLTSLNQYMMPFIRYKLDDLAYFVDQKCACGSNSRRIVLLPGKDRIIGTKLYGNRYFKDITCYLNSGYKITKYHSISVIQVDTLNFIVNVKNNQEDKEMLERCFNESSKLFFNRDDYKYSFTYDDNLESDSIFTISNK